MTTIRARCRCGAAIMIPSRRDAAVCKDCDARNAELVAGLALDLVLVDEPAAIVLARVADVGDPRDWQ